MKFFSHATHKLLKRIIRLIFLGTTFWLLTTPQFFAQAAPTQVHTTGAGLVSKVAPGEFLPVSMKLLNFGSGKKVDVSVSYEIVDSQGNKIYSADETVAVETTASFVKNIQIPFETAPGNYRAKSSITYKDQDTPATTEFPFMVERKIAGLFQSEFYLYFAIMVFFACLAGVLGHMWVKHRRASRLTPFDYAHIPSAERIYYELVSDTIGQMRQHAGDTALEIAKSIPSLVIENNSGRVLEMKEDPAKIMALLILKYENLLGQKVSFAMRNSNSPKKGHLSTTDKNLVLIKKYFQ